MFEKSFERPHNYFDLSCEEMWEIDKRLGILDWEGAYKLSDEDKQKWVEHYAVGEK